MNKYKLTFPPEVDSDLWHLSFHAFVEVAVQRCRIAQIGREIKLYFDRNMRVANQRSYDRVTAIWGREKSGPPVVKFYGHNVSMASN